MPSHARRLLALLAALAVGAAIGANATASVRTTPIVERSTTIHSAANSG